MNNYWWISNEKSSCKIPIITSVICLLIEIIIRKNSVTIIILKRINQIVSWNKEILSNWENWRFCINWLIHSDGAFQVYRTSSFTCSDPIYTWNKKNIWIFYLKMDFSPYIEKIIESAHFPNNGVQLSEYILDDVVWSSQDITSCNIVFIFTLTNKKVNQLHLTWSMLKISVKI